MGKKIEYIKRKIFQLILHWINFTANRDSSLLTFIPHVGCELDGYSFLNYKSDSALSMFHYIVEKYGTRYRYQIAAGECEKVELQIKAKELYPNLDIQIFPHPQLCSHGFAPYVALSRSKYIFTSQAIPMIHLNSEQEVYYLGYYSGNFKNDFIKQYQVVGDKYNRTYKLFFSTSLLFSQINSIVYNTPLSKFVITGLVRNDNLLEPYDCPKLDEWIKQSVDYEVKKVFLYTPTHRDYEKGSNDKRGILGFTMDREEMESFLVRNNIVIIIKLHSHQNLDALNDEVPKGILLHKSSSQYGLNELLQRSDYLITDYTSAYFDYLLLDRPVLFNFYDYDIYSETRGFSFDPISPILAGEKFSDQKTMIEKMQLVMRKDTYKEQRHFVRDLLFKYKDHNAAQRVYNYVFDDKKTADK